MTTYTIFTEFNDAEGETWRWYIPVEHNEVVLTELRAALAPLIDEDWPYSLADLRLTEEQVDTLVTHGNTDNGYRAEHTKVDAGWRPDPVKLATLLDPTADPDRKHDILYKGQLFE